MQRAALQRPAHCVAYLHPQGINFAAVWEEYDRLRQLRGHADHYPWPVAMRAFETLLSRGILTHADPRCAPSCMTPCDRKSAADTS